MPSRTFCFNAPLYRRTVLRLWPIWALASAVAFFLIPAALWQQFANGWSSLLEPGAQYFAQDYLYCSITTVSVGMAVLSCVSGLFTWNWMFTARSANCHFALPLRREGLFLTNYLAGLTVTLIPLLITVVLTALVELCFGGLDVPSLLTLLGAGAGAAVLFFSMATLCAVVTGNIVAMPVFYVIVNVLVLGIYYLVVSLLESFVFGMVTDWQPAAVLWCTPLLQMVRGCTTVDLHVIFINVTYYYVGGIENLWYFAVYAGAGVVLALCSMLAFRRRPAESAGDLIAFRPLRPVFQVGLALCFAVAMSLFVQTFYFSGISFAMTLVMVVGFGFIGYFGAEMLLRKSFRVFHARALRTWAIMTVCALAVLGVVKLDVFGYETRIPAEDEVESVTLYALNSTLETDYDTAVAIHQAILDGSRDDDGSGFSVRLWYTLNSGRSVTRAYSVNTDQPAFALISDWAMQPEALRQAAFGSLESADQLLDLSVYSYEAENGYYTLEGNSVDAAALYEALLADFNEGQSSMDYRLESGNSSPLVYSLDVTYYVKPYDAALYRSRSEYESECSTAYSYIEVTENMRHTVALLRTLDAANGVDWAEDVPVG